MMRLFTVLLVLLFAGFLAAEGTVGRDIVGTTFDAVRPTQDAINPDIVAQYVSDIRAGKQLEPISVGQQANGDLYILEHCHPVERGGNRQRG